MKTTRLLIACPEVFDALNNAGVLVPTPDRFMGYDVGQNGDVLCKLRPGLWVAGSKVSVKRAAQGESEFALAVPEEFWAE